MHCLSTIVDRLQGPQEGEVGSAGSTPTLDGVAEVTSVCVGCPALLVRVRPPRVSRSPSLHFRCPARTMCIAILVTSRDDGRVDAVAGLARTGQVMLWVVMKCEGRTSRKEGSEGARSFGKHGGFPIDWGRGDDWGG